MVPYEAGNVVIIMAQENSCNSICVYEIIGIYLPISEGVRDGYVVCNYILLENCCQKAGEFKLQLVTHCSLCF